MTSFPEAVAFERSRKRLPAGASPTSRLRHAWLHGGVVKPADGAKFGGTDALVYAARKVMIAWGFQFEDWRLVDPSFVPTERLEPAYKKKKRKPRAKVPATTRRQPPPLERAPSLDQGLVVYLVARDPRDGELRVGIRNGTEAWLCRVEGHVADLGVPAG